MIAAVAVAAGTLTGVSIATEAAHVSALCAAVPEEGNWRNINAATNGVTRAEIHLVQCGDQVLNGVRQPTLYGVRLFGKCWPSDCNWGQVNGQYDSSGWLRATYSFGFKTSYVWARTYVYYGLTYLRVYVWNDFHDGRVDYANDDWYLPG
jgi:hypothetical protein